MKFRTLIVDDEALARERIRMLLEGDPEIEVVGESSDGAEAVQAISRLRPELLFLDVQMPELDGFGVLQAVDHEKIAAIVFVTAFDQYAIQAFEYLALDYLLKPFDSERFGKTLDRAKAQIRQRAAQALHGKVEDLLDRLGKRYLERLAVKESGRVFLIKTEEVLWIEAQGNYVSLHTAGGAHLVRRTMKDLAAKLDPSRFLRVHRSAIVNLDDIRELHPLFHGEYSILLLDGTKLTSNRSCKEELQRLLGDKL